MHRQPRVRPVMAAISAAVTLVGLCAAASPATAAAPRAHRGRAASHASSATASSTSSAWCSTTCTSPGTTRTCRRTSSRCRTCCNFLEVQRHGAVEHAHAADRAHRRRQPDDLHRPLRRPARPAGDATPTRPTTRTARPTRRPRSRTGRPRSYDTASTPTAGHDTHADDGLLADRPGRRRRHRPADPGAVGAVHPGRLHRSATSPPRTWCWRTPALDMPHRLRRRTRPRSRSTTPTPIRSRTPRPPTTSVSRVHCAQGDAICADAQAVKYGQTTPSPTAVADPLPTEPGGYNGYQALFGARYVAPQLGAGTPNADPQRLPGHRRRPATWSTSTATTIRSTPSPASPASPASARPRRSRWPTSPTCRRAASRSPTATSPTCTSARPGTQRLHDRARRPSTGNAGRPGRQLLRRATPRPTTPRSRSSSSGWPADGITPANTRVRDQRRGERPVRRRQRRPGDPADTGRLRRRHGRRATTPPARSASCRPTSTPARRHRQRATRVRHRAAGRGDLRARPARARPIRRCASCSATPPR